MACNFIKFKSFYTSDFLNLNVLYPKFLPPIKQNHTILCKFLHIFSNFINLTNLENERQANQEKTDKFN
jgi:hypothetical protein